MARTSHTSRTDSSTGRALASRQPEDDGSTPSRRATTRTKTPTVFKWDAAREKALWLLFESKLSIALVAQNCGVAPRTIDNWIAHPVFQARLEQMRADLSATLRATLYVAKETRILALADMAQKARAEFEAHPLLTEMRPTKDGVATNERFNADAFAAFRGALDDIAKELGERKTVATAEVSGAVQHTLKIVYVDDWRAKQPPLDEPQTIDIVDAE